MRTRTKPLNPLVILVFWRKIEKWGKRFSAPPPRCPSNRVNSRLEKENGKLVWSFDISKPGDKNITEIHVDAISGAISSVETETPENEAKEKAEKEKKKK